MARAVVFHGPGRPLEVREIPEPGPIGAEVRIRVSCCTLCRSDLHTHAGRRVQPSPSILGHEVVGRVDAFGPDAPRVDARGGPLEVGDRVGWAVAVGCGACFFCRSDLPQKCERLYKYGHERLDPSRPLGGGLADFVILKPGTAIYRVPDSIPDAVAAPANCATATAAGLIRAAGGVEGRSVLVLGAGVLGLSVAAMARTSGASWACAADISPGRRDRSLRFGATEAVDVGPAMVAQMRSATDGRGVDVAFEASGAAEAVRGAIAAVRVGGTVVLAGTVLPIGSVAFDPEDAVRRMLTIRGVHNYHPRDLGVALDFLEGPGAEFPWSELVVAEYPLEAADRAFEHAHARPGERVAVVPRSTDRPA